MTRIRQDVWTRTRDEGDWPAVLVAYEQAVGKLRTLDPSGGKPVNPLGWRFLAAIHGLAKPDGKPDTSNPFWSNCQHGSWFFLPWHRMYLRAFELIIQSVLDDDNWSLPYWYAIDPDDRATAVLPPAFREQRDDNNLYTGKRSMPINAGQPLPDLSQALINALNADVYSTAEGTTSFGSGERAAPSFNGEETGLLEDVPHGGIHGLVGNDYDSSGTHVLRRGWMGSFVTAALDPIFWLHHANIDRLWQVWLDEDPTHTNPAGDTAWLETSFSFPAAGGGLATWSIGEVLDTTALGYKYESTQAPSGVVVVPARPPAGPLDIGLAEAPMPQANPPQVIGATRDVALTTSEPIDVQLSEPVDLGLAAGPEFDPSLPQRVFLRIEGLKGSAAAPVYEVYLNVPTGESPTEHPELRAGLVSTFGLAETAQKDDLHDGSGLTKVLDVTRIRDALEREGRWDPGRVQVSFAPLVPTRDSGEDDFEQAEAADIRAGQITFVIA